MRRSKLLEIQYRIPDILYHNTIRSSNHNRCYNRCNSLRLGKTDSRQSPNLFSGLFETSQTGHGEQVSSAPCYPKPHWLVAQQPAYKPVAVAVDERKVLAVAGTVAVDTAVGMAAVGTVAVDTAAGDTVVVDTVVGMAADIVAAERIDLPKHAAAKHGVLVLSSLAERESIVAFLESGHTQGQSRRRRLAEKLCPNLVGGKRLIGFVLC